MCPIHHPALALPTANADEPFSGSGYRRGGHLAFTRCCHDHYCMACIATKDGREETLYCAIVWAMKGGGGAQTRGVFANYSIDFCIKASNSTNILLRSRGHLVVGQRGEGD